jgi:TPR repeat protein
MDVKTNIAMSGMSSRLPSRMGLMTAAALVGFTLLAPAAAFDGTRTPPDARLSTPDRPVPPRSIGPETPAVTPFEAFRSGARALRAGEMDKAVTSLEYAAEQGHPVAQWKLGRMYADGEGVKRNDLRAFEYFSRIANAHADDNPSGPQSRFVASAFVALGHYHLEGIPESRVKPDAVRARQMYAYAASYFGDADAQYHLGRMYLEGTGVPKDARQAGRWLLLAAQKGQHHAQAVLGSMLFKGDQVQRQGARGLMWLTLAAEARSAEETWIAKLHEAASKQATDDEKALALSYLERWLRGRRD